MSGREEIEQRVVAILSPAIDCRAPYAKQMVKALLAELESKRRPSVTHEITGRVHGALRQFMVEHRKPITGHRYLYATFWELQNAIEADMPELLEDATEEAP